ncbi:peptidase T [Bacillus sp. FJAT-18017]|uniref:peptidase T n=1 Tax=Bacillus sp. FJAT-18017 TaxID=1705566 RepID=UPI0006AE6BD6|nr:peptidase T [Bacillus sp. FJAT-18017]ALC88607.1 peptidase T [Bacillus sp. FJAT-18017]
MEKELIDRFISYIKIDTQSSEESESFPSTYGQLELANMLVNELKRIGMAEVTMDANGYVMATLPANTEKDVPVIGFLAHVDTATDFTGKGVNPRLVENYDGKDITLNETSGVVMKTSEFPQLANYTGHKLITTDGTTLLGADNKAGVAEIITAMDYLIQNPDIKHGKIRVAFTPDEEIGRGPHRFDVQAFSAQYAYTVDGGPLGELEFESFNAAAAKLTFKGSNIHPGTAKGKMVNSMKLAMDFHHHLPASEAPELTEGYEGFYHLLSFNGDVEETRLNYIIRDFDKENFEARKEKMREIAADLKKAYGENAVILELNDQYYNMKEKIEPVKEIVDIAHKVMTGLDISPIVKPIRGGTDGSQLSYMGLPTPNIFTGGENFHGKYEFISVDNMLKAVQVIIGIAESFEKRA